MIQEHQLTEAGTLITKTTTKKKWGLALPFPLLSSYPLGGAIPMDLQSPDKKDLKPKDPPVAFLEPESSRGEQDYQKYTMSNHSVRRFR